uniref:Uncharacterized protein n=1 Tax=Magallana gigas TaxID=29159 RepID=K1RWW2_MAGGI
MVKSTENKFKIHLRLFCRAGGRGGEEFLFRTGQEFSRFLTTLLNLKNGSKMTLSTENKFSKLPGEVLKTAADSFYATQFNFTMRRGTILKQLPDTDKDVLIKK